MSLRNLLRCSSRCLFLLVLFLFSRSHYAQAQAIQNNYGDAPYFATDPRFPQSPTLSRINNLPRFGISFLWNTAGNSTGFLSKIFQTPGLDFVEAIAINETCVSRGDCGSYEFLHGYTSSSFQSAVAKGDPKVIATIKEASSAVCQFSQARLGSGVRKVINPLLETHLSRQNFSKVAGWVQEVCPGWEIVWNPVGPSPGAPQPPATLSEGHGPNPRFVDNRCIANPDGSVITDWEAFFRAYPGCAQVFSWTPNDNCIAPGQPRLDPRQRPCRTTDNNAAINAAARKLIVPIPTAPPWAPDDDKSLQGCQKVLMAHDGSGGFVWKESETKKTPAGKLAAVTLLPSSSGLDSSTKEVSVFKAGMSIDSMTFVYLYTADNSKRPVWQGHKAPADYPFNVVLKGTGPKGKFCWKIPNPHTRND